MVVLATSASSLSTLRLRFSLSDARPCAIPTLAIALELAPPHRPPQPRLTTNLGSWIVRASPSKSDGAGGRGRDSWKVRVWRLDEGLSLNGLERRVSRAFLKLLVGVMLAMSLSLAISNAPLWALSEENLLFLEAWRTLDRAYIDNKPAGLVVISAAP